jgi:hypothetical protein
VGKHTARAASRRVVLYLTKRAAHYLARALGGMSARGYDESASLAELDRELSRLGFLVERDPRDDDRFIDHDDDEHGR